MATEDASCMCMYSHSRGQRAKRHPIKSAKLCTTRLCNNRPCLPVILGSAVTVQLYGLGQIDVFFLKEKRHVPRRSGQ